MTKKKNIFVIIGSASRNSANEKLIDYFEILTKDIFNLIVFKDLKKLPHFDPELSTESPPKEILEFRKSIEIADGIILCTPEYVFSLPSGLKNAIEWCVSTTVFTDKPIGIITASASGQRGHEELQLIMKTLMAKFTEKTTLLISGIKGQFNSKNVLNNLETIKQLEKFMIEFQLILN